MSGLSSIRALMLDLSGTLHIENVCTPRAIEALKRLDEQNIPYLLVTNTTKESSRKVHQRLLRMGFSIEQRSIFSSLTAAAKLCGEKQLTKPLLMLTKDAKEEFQPFVSNLDSAGPEDHDSVVIGLSREDFDYNQLNKAFRILKGDPEAPLIAIHKSKYFQTNSGLELGPGCFVQGLEFSSGKRALVVGKPSKSFFDEALKTINERHNSNILPNETLMVGDDVEMDVLGAQDSGLKGCLVRTGKYRDGDEERCSESSGQEVNFVFDTLHDLVQAILNAKK